MSKYKVEISGIDTSCIPVLSNAEMEYLFKKMQNVDVPARDV